MDDLDHLLPVEHHQTLEVHYQNLLRLVLYLLALLYSQVPLVAAEDYAVGLHLDAVDKIKGEVVYKGPLYAPVKEGDVVGELVITAPGTPTKRIPVAAGATVNQLGFFGKAMLGLRGD